jgi:hypothetical protein
VFYLPTSRGFIQPRIDQIKKKERKAKNFPPCSACAVLPRLIPVEISHQPHSLVLVRVDEQNQTVPHPQKMLTSSSASTSSPPIPSSRPNSLFTLTPPTAGAETAAAATGVVPALALVLAFFAAGAGTASSCSSSAFLFSLSPSTSSPVVSATTFLALFLEAGVAVVAAAAAVFLFGVLGCGVVLLLVPLLLVWRVEERAPYL